MTEEQATALSALMDGELAQAPAQRAVDATLRDPALREQWARYHAIGDALRGTRVAGADDMAARVWDALEREPVNLVTASRARAWPGRHLATLAASLAVLAVVVTLVLNVRQDVIPGQGEVASLEAPQKLDAAQRTPPKLTVQEVSSPKAPDDTAFTRLTWNDPRPDVERRLNGYLLNHNEYLATGVRGMLPYARVVGYDPRN